MESINTNYNATICSLARPSWVPCRESYRDNINDYFTCLICEFSITREEQCVYFLNTNDFIFIPEQFASHHFWRKLVSDSYISMDPNENENNNVDDEMISNDDAYNSENDTNEQKSAQTKSSPLNNNKVHSLNSFLVKINPSNPYQLPN